VTVVDEDDVDEEGAAIERQRRARGKGKEGRKAQSKGKGKSQEKGKGRARTVERSPSSRGDSEELKAEDDEEANWWTGKFHVLLGFTDDLFPLKSRETRLVPPLGKSDGLEKRQGISPNYTPGLGKSRIVPTV
jgi:hypothetical protein